ncbi:MAG: ATP-dependent Clp protease adaptor ClpS [Nitrospira sp.]|nr:ATP-dependent Clp protease adaptor ClpS [Nitrospira sp.]
MSERESTGVIDLIEEEDKTAKGSPWCVILFNDEFHSFDEVILQVQKATGVSLKTAFEITLEAHTMGRAVCFSGPLPDCERVAGILRQIDLHVEIEQALE